MRFRSKIRSRFPFFFVITSLTLNQQIKKFFNNIIYFSNTFNIYEKISEKLKKLNRFFYKIKEHNVCFITWFELLISIIIISIEVYNKRYNALITYSERIAISLFLKKRRKAKACLIMRKSSVKIPRNLFIHSTIANVVMPCKSILTNVPVNVTIVFPR